MKKITIFCAFFWFTLATPAQDYKYKYPYEGGVSKEKYERRRSAALEQLPKNAAALFLSPEFFSNEKLIKRNDIFSRNLMYLTGVPPQKAALLLYPSGYEAAGDKYRELLFLKEQSRNGIIWNGVKMNPEDAESVLGFKRAADLSLLEAIVVEIAEKTDTLYVDKYRSGGHFAPSEGDGFCEPEILAKARSSNPNLEIVKGVSFLKKARRVKDEDEIRLLRKAVNITVAGHFAAIKKARAKVPEYELEAAMEYTFRKLGASGPAYPSIVGAGLNSCFLHYKENDDIAENGDLVLMDCGARYQGYCADITRTIPVSGKFTKEQRIIYNVVLEAADSAIALCKSGADFSAPNMKAVSIIKKRLKELGIISKAEDYDKYFPHGTSHYIGLDVHDGAGGELEQGVVLTVEPGIYIPERSPCDEKWHNIGVRIEDDILITKDGYENLSRKLPRKAEEIEKIVGADLKSKTK